MEMRIELPLDSDGYIRRQCPRCERVFKWHHAASDDVDGAEEDTPEEYYCPYCGEPSAPDQWFTDEQVDYIQALASAEALRMVEQQLKPTVDTVNRAGGFIKMDLEVPNAIPPAPLFEPDDMVAVEPPCHPEEPIKVEPWDGKVELHCLVCGDPFVVTSASSHE